MGWGKVDRDKLPEGVTRVEWLGQGLLGTYIKTGVVPPVGSILRCEFQFTDTRNSFNAIGNIGNERFGFGIELGTFKVCTAGWKEIIAGKDTNWHTWTIDEPNGIASLDNTSVSINSHSTFTGDVWKNNGGFLLFRRLTSNGGQDYATYGARCKSLYIGTSSGALFDGIPVRFTNEQGVIEGAMWDKVSKQLFRNADNNGAFLYGPDTLVSKPVISLHRQREWANPYVTDGLVAMWDGEWNAGGGVHDPNATTWVDFVGGYDAQASTYGGTFSFTANSCEIGFQGNTATGCGVLVAEMGAIGSSVLQIENVYSRTGTDAAAALCLCGVSNRQFLCANESGVLGMYGYTQYGATNLSSNDLHSYSISLTGGWPILSAAYADGTPLDISGYKPSITQGQTYSEGRMFIGYRAFSQNPTVSIKNIRLYNRVLTAAEIAANYAVDKARFNLP